jgi:hypothetical protein
MDQGDKRKTVRTKDRPTIKPRVMPKVEPEPEEAPILAPDWFTKKPEPAVMPAIPIEVEIGQYQ